MLRILHSFPTRRSSDLLAHHGIAELEDALDHAAGRGVQVLVLQRPVHGTAGLSSGSGDRKSTRLNSSHVANSYAVFCLKKNNTHDIEGKTIAIFGFGRI